MENTPNLKLPYIMPSQAQKHVTHNEALQRLDALLHLSVTSRFEVIPPNYPSEGERYIVANQPQENWSDHAYEIASYQDGGWQFYVPLVGWMAYVQDENVFVVFDGSTWNSCTGPLTNITKNLSINATTETDTINRLTLRSSASLFNHEGAGHQLKINKQAAADTASLLFQTNFSGRAEMGLSGNDEFGIKVSDDFETWHVVMETERETGKVIFPQGKLVFDGTPIIESQDSLCFHIKGNLAVGAITPTTRLHVDGPIRPANYKVADLPSASTHGAGAFVFVSDTSSGAQLVYSDGSAWRIVRDGTIVG